MASRWFLGLVAALLLPSVAFAQAEGAGVNPGTAGTRSLLSGCVYRSGAIAPVDGQQMAIGCDNSGQLKIGGTINASSSARATAAAPTYVEGTDDPFSMDLSGRLRVLGSFSSTTAANTGAAVPTQADYIGLNNGGNLIGFLGDSSGRGIVAGAGTAGSPAGGVLSVQGVGSGTALPVSGTFWQATQPVSGTFWQATQPVSLASLPALATGANVIGSLVANQSVNNAQIGGVSITVGNGVVGTGVQRVTLASDSTGQVTLAAGSATIGALTANQSVNNAQIAGAAVSTGNGVVGTGVQRVAIASDNTAFSTNATEGGATGAAVPARAVYNGVVSGGNLVGLIQADASAAISVSTATTTQIVALSAAKKIYVVAFDVIAGGAGNITFVYGTGSNCGTGTTSLTGAYPLTAQAGLSKGGGLGPVLVVPASNALCVTTSAAVQMSGSVAYTQF